MCQYIIELCSLKECGNHTRVTTHPCIEKSKQHNPFPRPHQCPSEEQIVRSSTLLCTSCKISRHAKNVNKRRGVIFSKTIQEGELFLPSFPPSPPLDSPDPDFKAFKAFNPVQKSDDESGNNKGKNKAEPIYELPADGPIHPLRLNPLGWTQKSSDALDRDSLPSQRHSYQAYKRDPRPLQRGSYQAYKRDSSFLAASPGDVPRNFGSARRYSGQNQTSQSSAPAAQGHVQTPARRPDPMSFRERAQRRSSQNQQDLGVPPSLKIRRGAISGPSNDAFELEGHFPRPMERAPTPPPRDDLPSFRRHTRSQDYKQQQKPKEVSPHFSQPQSRVREQLFTPTSHPATSFRQMEASRTNSSRTPQYTSEQNIPIQNSSVIPSVRRYTPLHFEGTVLDGVRENTLWGR